jgi:uncharacterized protein
MRPSIALNTHRDAIRAIALRHRVTDVWVFGSVRHIPVDVLTPNALPAKFRAEVLAQAQAL